MNRLQLIAYSAPPSSTDATHRARAAEFRVPDLGHAEGIERVLAAGDSATIRDGEDDLGGAAVGADLDTALGGDELNNTKHCTLCKVL